uniref:Uncharacterized protein n=1 Tax=Onchocerca volvulus TaxID=6282 RepID=A0A8R1U0M3_ONCVO
MTSQEEKAGLKDEESVKNDENNETVAPEIINAHCGKQNFVIMKPGARHYSISTTIVIGKCWPYKVEL